METIPIKAIPNQTFTLTPDSNRYSISIQECDGSMAITISINDVEVVSASECVSGSLLIPYKYLENGNFTFVTTDDEIPYYEKFGISQNLVYLSQDELDSIRSE